MGTKRRFEHPLAIYRMIHDRQLRPVSHAPPRRLDNAVRLSVRYVAGWPVYDVVPKSAQPQHRILFLHGGAYISEIAPIHWNFVARLVVKTHARVTVPIYPLAPRGTAEAIVPAVSELARELIADAGPQRTTLVGDSAGGGLALAAAQQLRDHGVPPPQLILLSPWLDLTMSDPEIVEIGPRDPMLAPAGLAAAADAYRGEIAATDPRVSPLFGDLLGLGRIMVFSGTRDILNADARRLVNAAAALGVSIEYHEADDMLHVYALLPIAEGRRARRRIFAALRSPRAAALGPV